MRTILFLLLIALLGLFACSANNSRVPLDIESFSLVSSIPTAMQLSKAMFYPPTGMLYVMSSKTHEIGIFKDANRLNVLGGVGTGTGNFMSLGDIGIAPDGSLLALDTLARSLKKFTSDGKAVGVIELKNSVQPSLFCMHADQSIFVFDAASAEIIAYSALDGSEQYRFGKFQLGQPSSLTCNRDYVIAYDLPSDTSHMFSVLGQFIKSDKGQTLFDEYNNGINLYKGNLVSQMSAAYLPVTDSVKMYGISRDILVLGMDSEIRLLKIAYLQVN